MIKLCINCNTENPVDAVICSECGMSLTRAATGETAAEARSMASVQDTAEPEATRMRAVRWGLALAGMVFWTFFAALGTFFFWVICWMSVGSMLDGRGKKSTEAACRDGTTGGVLLALAPWVIGGIVLGVRWWRSRTPARAEATE